MPLEYEAVPVVAAAVPTPVRARTTREVFGLIDDHPERHCYFCGLMVCSFLHCHHDDELLLPPEGLLGRDVGRPLGASAGGFADWPTGSRNASRKFACAAALRG